MSIETKTLPIDTVLTDDDYLIRIKPDSSAPNPVARVSATLLKGQDGTNGTNGVDGQDGTNGTNGVDGQDGAPGTNGVDGQDGTNGTNGVDGQDGTDGINGTDGRGILNTTISQGAEANGLIPITLTLFYTDGTSQVLNFSVPVGEGGGTTPILPVADLFVGFLDNQNPTATQIEGFTSVENSRTITIPGNTEGQFLVIATKDESFNSVFLGLNNLNQIGAFTDRTVTGFDRVVVSNNGFLENVYQNQILRIE